MPAVVKIKQSDVDAAYQKLYELGLVDIANLFKARIALLEAQVQQLALEVDDPVMSMDIRNE